MHDLNFNQYKICGEEAIRSEKKTRNHVKKLQ